MMEVEELNLSILGMATIHNVARYMEVVAYATFNYRCIRVKVS